MTETVTDEVFSPPYLSFETFRNFVQRLNPRALPPRIDRSMMIGMAGGTQSHLIQAMKQFRLIGDSNEVLPRLVAMTRGDEGFTDGMREILLELYGPQLELARQQATPAQLTESFVRSGYTGSTLRKAITFFLHAAKAAEVPLSPHFRPPRAAPPATRNRRTKPKPTAPSGFETPVSVTPAESHTIDLSSGGTITLSCTTSFLSLTREDREFLFDLVDRLKEYQAARLEGTPTLKALDGRGGRD